jgi:hypothetical protein
MQNIMTRQEYNTTFKLIQVTIWTAYSSAVIAAIGLLFLAIFFSGFPIFGPLNDVAVIIHYILLLPIVLTVWNMLRPYGEGFNNLALIIGLIGITAVIVLQSLLVLGVVPFRQQIVMVIPAFLVAMLWFVLTGRLGRTDDRMPKGIGLHILAGLVIGYPIWAFKFANNLQRTSKEVRSVQ